MNENIYLVASGDSRITANQRCWPAQEALESAVISAFNNLGKKVVRGHAVDPVKKHGFIDGQIRGIEVFREIPIDAPVVVAEAVWQYSAHVLAGLIKHRGPILTLANWSGQWPGLVGMLNLNGSLTKAGVPYSTIWSEDFKDEFALNALRQWVSTGKIEHKIDHARELTDEQKEWPELKKSTERGRELARELRSQQAIMGIFDEGCMGMYNAIIPDDILINIGLFKERLSQSALYAAMLQVPDDVARAHYDWLLKRGMKFIYGKDPATELTEDQVIEGLKMYDAAVRFAHDFGCDLIGIQYQQGLKDLCVASDLAEGLLNNPDRPPVKADGKVLFEGKAVTHFNEVDEGAGLDGLLTNRVLTSLGLDTSNTLHDVRWGDHYKGEGVDEFVWVFEISGAVPASHFINGYEGARGERQPPMYFPKGGSTVKGISRPGEIVWSRIYVENNQLYMDIGRGGVVKLPDQETQRRWDSTTPQWPIMHAVLYGVTRDQFMAKHKANHVQVHYAPDPNKANEAMAMKAAMALELGIKVNLCGDLNDNLDNHQAPQYRK
jgi:hypothetical protein